MNNILLMFLLLSPSIRADSNRIGEISFKEFFARFDRAELNGCGVLNLCWYDPDTKICNSEYSEKSTLEFKVESLDPKKRAYLAINYEKIERIFSEGGTELITYREVYPKSLPPGPGRSAGLKSRYTLTIIANDTEIIDFLLYQEDFDLRTKQWKPIRLNLDNPIHCQ